MTQASGQGNHGASTSSDGRWSVRSPLVREYLQDRPVGWSERVASRRLRLGRLAVYVQPRDLWVGAFVGLDAVYVCPLPTVVIRWDRC